MAKEPSYTLNLSELHGPPLQRTLQFVCETGSPTDACNLLRTCRWIRTAAQHSCAGLVPINCSSKRLHQQALAVAAWLKHNPLLARSLSIEFSGRWKTTPNSEDRQATVSTLAQALQTSTSICLISSCCLLNVGPECVEVLQVLPSRQLTSLQMSLWQPSNATFTDAQVQNIASALSQLQQLESVVLGFGKSAPPAYNIGGLDCLLIAMSEMSKLTSLTLEGVSSNAELRQLPRHLQEFEFQWHPGALEFEVQLRHLTQLTKLVMNYNPMNRSDLLIGSTLPAGLQQLTVGEFESVATLTQLSQLKDLSLEFSAADNAGAEALAQLSTIKALTSVYLCYQGDALSSSLEEATSIWERLPVRRLSIGPCWSEDVQPSPSVAQHMTCLTQLTQLDFTNVDFLETTCEQFAAALKHLTALQRLELYEVKYRAAGSAQLANTGDCVSDETICDAATGPGTATTQCEHADAVDPDKVAAIVATLEFEHVAEAIASLPDLCALTLGEQPITPKAAQLLCFCCGGVKELCLVRCSLTDATLGRILEGLCDVEVLDVSTNYNLTDQVLLLMRDHLHSVGKYVFAGTQITTEGVNRYLPDCDAVLDYIDGLVGAGSTGHFVH